MATLDQLYRAYLSGDPNVSQMTYDPFGWNYEQTFDTTEEGTDTDTGIGAVVSPTTTGGDNYSVYNPDPNKIRLPSSYRETSGLTEAHDQLLANQQLAKMGIDNPWANEANLGEAYYGDMYDVNLEPGQQGFWYGVKNKLLGNPLMQGVMSAVNPAMNFIHGLAQTLPVNERAILENQALGSGVALDDIGRVVQQQGLDYDTAENVMAGYNYAQMDEDTFDDRIEKIRAGNMSAPGKKTRIKAIKAAKQAWLESKRKTNIIAQKQRLDRADDDQKATIKEFKTRENILEDDIFDKVSTTTPKNVIVPPAKPKRTTTIQDTGRDDRPSTPSFDPGGGFVDQGGQGEFGGGTSKSAPQRDYSSHHAYGLNRGGIVDLL
mgnify:FL=1|tara:strand:+ start:3345 stop:4472 length:1128 start_codon:yes stop_codon:yes gene_type:complete